MQAINSLVSIHENLSSLGQVPGGVHLNQKKNTSLPGSHEQQHLGTHHSAYNAHPISNSTRENHHIVIDIKFLKTICGFLL